MLDKALTHLRSFIRSTTICFKLLPSAFTLTTLENLFETVLNEHIDKRNFRKKVQKLKVLKSLKQKTVGMKHRPAELFGPQSSSVLEISLF